ncbi:hypothetical protein BDZ91DRAFT_724903 [Kalaharituber pfeilii]|nr:hypothetical protein BDZ91DRAFT_724903 [Kalaharituber pfeilii]
MAAADEGVLLRRLLPPPSPATTPIPISVQPPPGAGGTPISAPTPLSTDSAWYARHPPSAFLTEFYVLLLLTGVVLVHKLGVRRNRQIAHAWLRSHLPLLESEFAMVGFDARGQANTLPRPSDDKLLAEARSSKLDMGVVVREDSPTEFISYASGRNNVAFAHIRIELMRRNNPFMLLGEYVASFLFDSIPEPRDNVTITISPFDGAETALVPSPNPEASGRVGGTSKYDNFIWAIVNKKTMHKWRQERYDLSLTTTRDWEGMPKWCSVMTEAKEIGDVVLTEGLRKGVGEIGEQGGLEYLIVSDQRIEKPTRIEETAPKKRLTLHLTLPTTPTTAVTMLASLLPFLPSTLDLNRTPPTLALVSAFLRLPDHLVSAAHFRPEVHRKLKATREEQARVLAKQAEEDAKEEREQKRAEAKKREREEKLRGMSAEEQRKWLEREKEKETRKAMKKGKVMVRG